MIDKFCVTDEDGAVQFAMTMFMRGSRPTVQYEFAGDSPALVVTDMDVNGGSTALCRSWFGTDWEQVALFNLLKTREGRALEQKWRLEWAGRSGLIPEGQHFPYDYLVKPVESQWGTK